MKDKSQLSGITTNVPKFLDITSDLVIDLSGSLNYFLLTFLCLDNRWKEIPRPWWTQQQQNK